MVSPAQTTSSAADTREDSPIRSGKAPAPLGTCGRPRPGVETRIVDENDCEVAPGEVGELIVRTAQPWRMTVGYFGMPEKTAVPKVRRISAPAPWLVSSGTTPRIKANDVMMMGRSRSLQAASVAS